MTDELVVAYLAGAVITFGVLVEREPATRAGFTAALWLPAIAPKVAAAVGLSAGVAKAEEYPELKLRLAHFVPSQLTGSKVDQWWADEI